MVARQLRRRIVAVSRFACPPRPRFHIHWMRCECGEQHEKFCANGVRASTGVGMPWRVPARPQVLVLAHLERASANFDARESTPGRRVATATLARGPRAARWSVGDGFGVGHVVPRHQMCGAAATLGKSGLPWSGHGSLWVVRALGTGSSSLDGTNIVGPVQYILVHVVDF